jgi:hypothetical protein
MMMMNSQWRMAMSMAIVALALGCGTARAQEVPLITGEHWTTSTEQMKKAYLVGMANVVHVETAYQGTNAPSDAQSVLPRLVRGLKGQTLDSVREALDRWYAANPGRVQRPVIETLWFELVLPGLQKNR